MPACSAPNCTNRQEKGSEKTFHLFPTDGPLRQKWIKEVSRELWTPSKRSLLCSDHFTESCFDTTGPSISLRDDAVPTLFDMPAPKKKKVQPKDEPMEVESPKKVARGRPRKKQKLELDHGNGEGFLDQAFDGKGQDLEQQYRKQTKLSSKRPQSSVTSEIRRSPKKRQSTFTSSRRQILMKVAYLGWDYQRCAVVEEIQQNIEDNLLQALLETNLMDAESSTKFERCGHSKEGFNPFDQIISMVLRSRCKTGLGVIPPTINDVQLESDEDGNEEIDYLEVVNGALPPDMRVIAWCPIDAEDIQDLDTPTKTFKYFFPKGNLDLELMNDAAQNLIGENSYKNLYDKDATRNKDGIIRSVLSTSISPVCCDLQELYNDSCVCHLKETANNRRHKTEKNGKRLQNEDLPEVQVRSEEMSLVDPVDGYEMCVISIHGQHFLTQEIRKIMTILIRIGQKKLDPYIFSKLLGENKNYRYSQLIASEVPLILFKTSYEEESWIWSTDALKQVITKMQTFWVQYSASATSLKHMLREFENQYTACDTSGEEDTYLPQNQYAGLIGRDIAKLSKMVYQKSQNDHEYSTSAIPDATDGPEDIDILVEMDFNHIATMLLIEVISRNFPRFLKAKSSVFKEVQEELIAKGFSVSVEKIQRKWNNLVITYRKIKGRIGEDSSSVLWDYYEVLDDLLSPSLDVPTSDVDMTEALSSPPCSPLSPDSSSTVRPSSPETPVGPFKSPSLPERVTYIVNKTVPVKTEPGTETPVIRVMQYSPSEANHQPSPNASPRQPSPKTPPIVVLSEDPIKEEKVPVKCKTGNPSGFLEYHVQQGEKRLDMMEEYFEYMKERLKRKMDYRQRKESTERRSIAALRSIGGATEKMKNGLLELKAA